MLGGGDLDVSDEEAGEVLAERLIEMMHTTAMPNGVNGVGYNDSDISDLVEGAYAQQRLLQQSPREVSKESLAHLYSGAMNYW